MSEVKRYTESCMEGGGVVESKDGELADYSALAGALSQLTALREELATANEYCDAEQALMQSKLTAAEKRNADHLKLIAGLVEYADNLLSDVNNAWSYAGSTGNPETHKDADYAAAVARIAKPTESGESEFKSPSGQQLKDLESDSPYDLDGAQ